MKRYIVTGAPGAGKTAIIRQLEIDGFGVVEEAATDVITLWRAKGIAEPWTHPEFIDAIVSLQQTREHRLVCGTDPQFHDRSVVCTAALADYLGLPRPQNLLEELRRVRAKNVFQTRVFFLKNLGFITRTEARRITYEETVRFERIHERTYQDLGFEVTLIDPGSVSDRVKQIKRILSLDGLNDNRSLPYLSVYGQTRNWRGWKAQDVSSERSRSRTEHLRCRECWDYRYTYRNPRVWHRSLIEQRAPSAGVTKNLCKSRVVA